MAIQICDDLKPIEIEMVDKQGNKEVKVARIMTINDYKLMDEMRKNTEGKDSFDVLCEIMCFIFGGKKEDYGKYSLNFINKVLECIRDEMTNPTSEVQEE